MSNNGVDVIKGRGNTVISSSLRTTNKDIYRLIVSIDNYQSHKWFI